MRIFNPIKSKGIIGKRISTTEKYDVKVVRVWRILCLNGKRRALAE